MSEEKDKLQLLTSLLLQKDFAYISNIWNDLSEKERVLYKTKIVPTLGDKAIVEAYEAFCFINRILANEILGFHYNKINKDTVFKKDLLQEKVSDKGIINNSLEDYIDFKVSYLQAFRTKLEARGFNADLINVLVSQELEYLNNLSLGGE